jgi:hypothetical protein
MPEFEIVTPESDDGDADIATMAFTDFRTTVGPRVKPVSLDALTTMARRRRQRRIAALAAAVAILIGVPATAYAVRAPAPRRHSNPAAPTASASASLGPVGLGNCTTLVLPPPAAAGAFTQVVRVVVDSTGRYVAAQLVNPLLADSAATKIIVWGLTDAAHAPGSGAVLSLPFNDPQLVAINAAGTVVGRRADGASGWVMRGGVYSALPSLDGQSMVPTSINNRGDIVGFEPNGRASGVIWPGDRPGTVERLPGSAARPGAIDDDGTIAGEIASVPSFWTAGAAHPLDPEHTWYVSEIVAIRGGWVLAMTGSTVLVWQPGRTTPNTFLVGSFFPADITADGALLGTWAGSGPAGAEPGSRAAIVRGTDVTVLPMPVPAAAQPLVNVDHITADGRIIVGSYERGTVIWYC